VDLLHPFKKQYKQCFIPPTFSAFSYLRGTRLSEIEDENGEGFISKAWFPDPDRGPEDIWRWATWAQTAEEFVFSGSEIPARGWAYMMWDRARLDDWKVFENVEKEWTYQRDRSYIS
jgi:hypothetical protein